MKNLPSAHTILLVLSGIVAMLTWVIPAGQYATLSYDATADVFIKITEDEIERLPATQQTLELLEIKIPFENFTSGAIYKPIGIPASYQSLESRPQGFLDFLQAPIKGIIETTDIIFMVLIIGGLIGIVEKSGAFSAGIKRLSKTLHGREYILIVSITLLAGTAGTTYGFGEEGIAFLPILIPIFIAARYDAMVAIACVFLGSQVGTMASTTNPFYTILASDAAGIKWTSDLVPRILMFVICISITILFILRYAQKVKLDPKQSVIYDQKESIEKLFTISHDATIPNLTSRLKLILIVFGLCFVFMVIGVSMLDWWFVEMTTTFFIGAILIGFIAKMEETAFIQSFIKGASELLGVAFIIGFARGISILMTDGLIGDTILYEAGNLTSGMGKGLFINVVFGVYNIIAFLVSSSSGAAVLTVPIIAPLADTVDIGRENIVNAFQFGHGLFNIINPTSLILAFLGVAQIGYDRFLKFIWPLFLALIVVIMIFLTLSVY